MTKAKKKKANTNFETKRLALSLLVIIFYFIWPSIVAALKNVLHINNDLIVGIISHVVLASVLLIIYRKDLIDYVAHFKKNKSKMFKTIAIYTLITIVAVAVVNGVVINVLDIDHVTANENSLLESFKTYPFWIAFLTIIYYPIVEEIVFEKTIKDVVSNKWIFTILSALFFWYYNIAYIGGIDYITIISSLYYFVAGFIRALAFYKTDNLYVPMCIKSLYNLFVTIIS